MKAKRFNFIGAYIEEQVVGGPNEMLSAVVEVELPYGDGKHFRCKSRIKQTVGSNYKDKVIEVGPIQGLPSGVEYDHAEFASLAREYYTNRIVKMG